METSKSAKAAPTNKKRILIVDDYPLVRKGIMQLLDQEADMEACGEATNATEAMQAIRDHGPDAVVVDISLPGTNGLELIKLIKGEFGALPIIIYSMYEEHLYADRAIRAGAMGYVMKHEPTEKLIDALRRVLAGEIYVSERLSSAMVRRLLDGKSAEESSPFDQLSDRELEVFQLIGQGLGTRQIAEKLKLSVKTIETHREHIKEKLNLDSGAALVHYAVRSSMQNG